MKVDVDPEQLSGVIGKIYDSALDPALWPEALEGACALIGGALGYIALFDQRNRHMRLLCQWGGDAHMMRSYAALIPHMPFWEIMTEYQIGQITNTVDMLKRSGLTEDEMLDTKFFREWAQPNGLRDVLAGIVVKVNERVASFNLHTPLTRDTVGPRDVAVMALLLPHVRRAVTIADMLDMKSLVNEALETTLNALASAVVLVDATGSILQANWAAQTMFSMGGPILSLHGKLGTHRADATHALRAAIVRATDDESMLGYGGIGVPIPGLDQNMVIVSSVAHVFPLKSGNLRPGLALGAAAAVFVTPPGENTPPPFETLAALYDLTPTEARVMVEIASGKNRAATAEALGIADSTVKTHLAHVFEKTRTSEQAELAKLVANLTPPVIAHDRRGR